MEGGVDWDWGGEAEPQPQKTKFVPYWGMSCHALPMRPHALHSFEKTHKDTAKDPPNIDRLHCMGVKEPPKLRKPEVVCLPCGALPDNVCPFDVDEQELDGNLGYTLLKANLSYLADFHAERAKLSEALYMFEARFPPSGDPPHSRRERRFALLSLPCYNPKVQQFIHCRLKEEGDGGHDGGDELPLPFAVTLSFRASKISPAGDEVIDCRSGSAIAFELARLAKTALGVFAVPLVYEIGADICDNHILAFEDEIQIFTPGRTKPLQLHERSDSVPNVFFGMAANLFDPIGRRAQADAAVKANKAKRTSSSGGGGGRGRGGRAGHGRGRAAGSAAGGRGRGGRKGRGRGDPLAIEDAAPGVVEHAPHDNEFADNVDVELGIDDALANLAAELPEVFAEIVDVCGDEHGPDGIHDEVPDPAAILVDDVEDRDLVTKIENNSEQK